MISNKHQQSSESSGAKCESVHTYKDQACILKTSMQFFLLETYIPVIASNWLAMRI